jgi:hypothetical protein
LLDKARYEIDNHYQQGDATVPNLTPMLDAIPTASAAILGIWAALFGGLVVPKLVRQLRRPRGGT